MSVKNFLNCSGQLAANTGFGLCVNDIKFIKGIFFVPTGTLLTTASIAALKTALAAIIKNDSPNARAYPLHKIVTPTDNSEDIQIQTFADGSKAVSRDVVYDWTFQFTDGAFCLSYALQQANGLNMDFFLYDAGAKLIGTQPADGSDNLMSINPSLQWTIPWKLPTGTEVTVYATRVSFDSYQVNKSIAFVDFTKDGGLAYLKSLKGLQNILLTKISRAVAVLKIGAYTSCGTVDLSQVYTTELAVASLWRAYAVNGNSLTITSVAYDANVKGFTVTIDTSDPDYVAGDPITVGLGPVSVLTTGGVVGFEGINVVVAP